MKKYFIHKIDETGRGRCVLEIEAETIAAAWMGCKSWFTDGIYYIVNADGYEGQRHTIERKEGNAEK